MTYLDDLAQAIRDQVPNSKLPHEDTRGLFRLYAVLLLGLGTHVTAADVHNAWVAWMCDRDASHESLVAYEALPADVAREDEPYVEAIRRVARRSGTDSAV
ncbi:MAG: DUF7701 domain-containing protein [Dermatophilaceae bacterium]